MPRSYTSILVHVVFSTYERTPFITPDLRESLHAYLGGIARNLGAHPIRVGGIADHVHLLAAVPPTLSIAEFLNKIKSNSSKWIHEATHRQDFAWQRGYGAFSVSPSSAGGVIRYIANQELHHHQVTFREEFLSLLKEAGVEFDERYVFA